MRWRRAGGNFSYYGVHKHKAQPHTHTRTASLPWPCLSSARGVGQSKSPNLVARPSHQLPPPPPPSTRFLASTGQPSKHPLATTSRTRRRFPLHLSFLLVIMTVAGSMLLLARGARGSTVACAALRGGVASCFVPASSSTNQSVRLPVRPLRVRIHIVCGREWRRAASCMHADPSPRSLPHSLPSFPPRRRFRLSRVSPRKKPRTCSRRPR